MVSIERVGNQVTVRVLGSHKIWALKSVIRFNREQVVAVDHAARSLRPPWLRCPGTAVPWLICAGTYFGSGRKEFWDRTIRGKGIRVDLRNGPYTRLVVDVADTEQAIQALKPV